MTEGVLQQLVEEFWAAAGQLEPFPRNLEEPVLWALPLAVVKVPRLWTETVEAWLEQHDLPLRLGCMNRPLSGCLVAYAGKGIVLLDGVDREEQRRFSLAHEVAHFLLDYLYPRRQTVSRLGHNILDVLDGLRPPTISERVHAVLSDVPIGVHTHLMYRAPSGAPDCSRVAAAESGADRLALELLAPAAEVRERAASFGEPPSLQATVRVTANLLAADFGLPLAVAEVYGKLLASYWHGGPSFREWLGF